MKVSAFPLRARFFCQCIGFKGYCVFCANGSHFHLTVMSFAYGLLLMKMIATECSACLARFQVWKHRLDAQPSKRCDLDRWLFVHGASVLLSEKTGELLNLNLLELDWDAESAVEAIEETSREWGVRCKILRNDVSSLKLLLYHPDRLDDTLGSCPSCILMDQLNYPEGLDHERFLEEIRCRWTASGELPHEIGIALGYPVEDVFGFMGLLPLTCKGCCGWQVYGCMKESRRRSTLYQRARCQAVAFLAA